MWDKMLRFGPEWDAPGRPGAPSNGPFRTKWDASAR